jgi:hypothetical protein
MACGVDYRIPDITILLHIAAPQVFEAWQAWTCMGVFNLLNPDLRPSGITNPKNSS